MWNDVSSETRAQIFKRLPTEYAHLFEVFEGRWPFYKMVSRSWHQKNYNERYRLRTLQEKALINGEVDPFEGNVDAAGIRILDEAAESLCLACHRVQPMLEFPENDIDGYCKTCLVDTTADALDSSSGRQRHAFGSIPVMAPDTHATKRTRGRPRKSDMLQPMQRVSAVPYTTTAVELGRTVSTTPDPVLRTASPTPDLVLSTRAGPSTTAPLRRKRAGPSTTAPLRRERAGPSASAPARRERSASPSDSFEDLIGSSELGSTIMDAGANVDDASSFAGRFNTRQASHSAQTRFGALQTSQPERPIASGSIKRTAAQSFNPTVPHAQARSNIKKPSKVRKVQNSSIWNRNSTRSNRSQKYRRG